MSEPYKTREYQQVAALVCDLIDILSEIVTDTSMSAQELREQIKDIHQQKDEIIHSPRIREERFNAMSKVYNLHTNA